MAFQIRSSTSQSTGRSAAAVRPGSLYTARCAADSTDLTNAGFFPQRDEDCDQKQLLHGARYQGVPKVLERTLCCFEQTARPEYVQATGPSP